MWGVVVFVLAGGAVILGSLLQGAQVQRCQRAWQDAAVSCGLQSVEITGEGEGLRARAGLLEVRIEESNGKPQSTRIVVGIPGPPDFYDVRILPKTQKPLRSSREIEIGHEFFDNTFSVLGPVQLVCALLDAEMCQRLVRVNAESRLTIVDGALRAEVPEEAIPRVLPLLLDIGQRLAQPMDIPRRLAENANRDPEAKVRLRNLLLLVRELPQDPGTSEALRKACSDPSPEIRLRAAKELGAAGREALLELAESPVDDALSAEAVSILDRELPFERTRAILDYALSRGRTRTARACLEGFGRSGGAAAVETLAKVLARGGELATVAARALGMTASASAEPSLILALQWGQADLQVAAATALGRVGSAAAVLPLKEAVERSRFDRELRRAARQAIAEIKSRLLGASPGQLSLAGDETGQLSLAEAEAGQLSITDLAGQLSLDDDEEEES
jgi:HEAT repeat protein